MRALIALTDANTTPPQKVWLDVDSIVVVRETLSSARARVDYCVGSEARVLYTDEGADGIMKMMQDAVNRQGASHG